MATTKEVKVVINGTETVSAASKSAEGGIAGFTNKIPGWAKAAAVITAAYAAISAAVSKVSDFIMDSFDAFDAYAASQSRLSAQAKITGLSVDDLRASARRAREEFGLSATVANDAAVTVGKYATRAGDATLQNKLLAAALDLGAASGLDAAASMQALEMGLRGQDEGFDKLLGKNPSTLWKEYADANDLAVGKMSDTEKRLAELTAVVEAGDKVQGTYNERLETGAGRMGILGNATDTMKTAFGEALQPIRLVIVNGLIALINISTPFLVAVAKMVNIVGVSLVGAFVLMQSAIGTVAQGIGKLTGNKTLENWGDSWSSKFPAYIEQVTKSAKSLDGMGTAATDAGRAHELATIKIVANAKDGATAVDQSATKMMEALDKKLGGPMQVVIGLTEQSIRSLADAANEQLPPETAEKFAGHMRTLADKAREVEERFTGIKPKAEGSADSTKSMASDIGTVARGALDAAQAFGVIDASAASALNSAINIADSISKIAGGNVFAGAAGVLGGVANIVNVMLGGDRERRRLLNENSDQLRRLREEGVPINTSISGDDWSKSIEALDKSLSAPGSQFAFDSVVRNQLRAVGLSMGDLDRIASDLGVTIRDKNGNLIRAAVQQLLGFLKDGSGDFGFGTDFESQLQSTRAGFDVNKVSESDQIGQLFGLGRQFRSVIGDVFDPNDLQGSRARLQDLFTRFSKGEISASELGGLTSSQFLNLITDLIGRIDNLNGDGGTGSTGGGTGGTGGGGGTGGDTGDGGDTGGVAFATLQTVVDTIAAQSEAAGTYYEASLGYQQRIADATEATATNTSEALQYLSILPQIAENLGIDTISAKIEDQRRQSLLAVGQFPTVR